MFDKGQKQSSTLSCDSSYSWCNNPPPPIHPNSCAIRVLRVKLGQAPGVNSLHRFTTGKTSKINISKASRWILYKLHTQHHLAVGKVAHCFWADLTGTLVAMATYTFKWKFFFKKIFSETTEPTALIFGTCMWQG